MMTPNRKLILTIAAIFLTLLSPVVAGAQVEGGVSGIDCDTVYPNKQYEIQLTLLDDFDDENNNTIFKLIDKNSATQLFCDSIFSSVGEIRFEDFNNDNIKDILIQHTTDVRSNYTWYLYLVDTTQNKLTKVEGFEEIKNPTYNTKYNIIENYVVSGTDWTSFYAIRNNTVFDFGYTIYFDEEENFQRVYDQALDKIRNFSIIAVKRNAGKRAEYVYITSEGRVIDSVRPYCFDNGPDAVHNGFIRFEDKHSELIGLLNRRGDVVIPAKYNYLSHVSNGFVGALIGADTVRDGEYLHFVGGEKLLLDTAGIVHIENFTPENIHLVDFYSVRQISLPADLDTVRINFLATNGKYYSFENYLVAFTEWLDQNLLADFTPERFNSVLYPEVRISIDYDERQSLSSDTLTNLYYDKFHQALIRIRDPDCEYFYSRDSFYPGYGSCRQIDNTDENPIIELIITSANGIQEGFNFYRTDQGYRLIEATFRSKSYGDVN